MGQWGTICIMRLPKGGKHLPICVSTLPGARFPAWTSFVFSSIRYFLCSTKEPQEASKFSFSWKSKLLLFLSVLIYFALGPTLCSYSPPALWPLEAAACYSAPPCLQRKSPGIAWGLGWAAEAGLPPEAPTTARSSSGDVRLSYELLICFLTPEEADVRTLMCLGISSYFN